ncbi:MAG: hypothetical protein Q4G67_01020 [Actinomycetia bacterium]|nr:hypothetical protein [Actinomycetes bacterium]
MGSLSWRDAGTVIADAGRLFWRHWPVLVFIYLLGAAGRNGFLWLSISVSERHATIAGFLLPLVPISSLVALILMLRALAPSLRHVDLDKDLALGPEAGPLPDGVLVQRELSRRAWFRKARLRWQGRARATYGRVRSVATARLALLAATLIPFLTLYAAEGHMTRDRMQFTSAAFYDEFVERGLTLELTSAINTDRLLIATGWALAAIVLGALVLRSGLDRFRLSERSLGWGLFAAYLEVLWLFLLANQFTGLQNRIWGWVTQRRFADWVMDTWAWFTGLLGPLADPVGLFTTQVLGALGRGDQLIVLPIAWLTVAAVVYGRTIAPPPRPAREHGPIMRGLLTALDAVPAPLVRVWNELTAGVRERFRALGNGIRLLIAAGVLPMLVFCVVFLLARQCGHLAQEIARHLIGPQDINTRLAFAPHVAVVTDGVYTVVLVVLLAAAIDRLLGRRGEGVQEPVVAEQVAQDEAGRTEPRQDRVREVADPGSPPAGSGTTPAPPPVSGPSG